MIPGGLPGKHTDTKAIPDSVSRNMRARLFQASTFGQNFYKGSHTPDGYWTVIDGYPIFTTLEQSF